MAQILNVLPPCLSARRPQLRVYAKNPSPSLYSFVDALGGNPFPKWTALQEELKCEGRHCCFFANGRKQDQARKALDNALDGKKSEFEKWNKEIEKREELDQGGGGGVGVGGGHGWGGGWFGWLGGENFWEESQQAILTILGIMSLFLLLTKGNTMFAIFVNPLLLVLRVLRTWFVSLSSLLSRGATTDEITTIDGVQPLQFTSAKERVVKKWGN